MLSENIGFITFFKSMFNNILTYGSDFGKKGHL